MLHIVHTEQLLKAHAADTGHGVQAGQCQRGNAHRHKDSCNRNGHAEHLKETGNAAAEDLERGTGGGGAVCSGGSTGNTQGEDSQQALKNHGAVADLEHILLILNGLGGGAGGNQTVEAGDGTAGDRDKEDGEHGAQLGIVEAGKDGQVHRGVGNQQADDSTGDHCAEHKGGHIVAGLLEHPHRQNCGKEDVNEGDVAPCGLAEHQRAVHADGKGQDNEDDTDDGLAPAGEVELLLDEAEHNGEHHEHDGNHAGRAVGEGGFDLCAVSIKGVEGAGNHVCKGSNDDAAEQPAEQQEQLAAGLADVLLDQQAHRLAVILDGSVQSAEVSDSAEKDAADQHPEQHRQPAEGRSLNGTGNRAGTGNGGELVCKHRPALGGNIILAILQPHSRSLGVGVNTPGLGEPTTVSGVRTYQNDRGNQNDYKRIHLNESLFPNRFYNRLCTLLYCYVLCLSTHCSQNSNMLIFAAKSRKIVV